MRTAKDKTDILSFRISKTTKKHLSLLAKEAQRSTSDYIRIALTAIVNSGEFKVKP